MDYTFKVIGIAFLVAVVLFIYNALKIQHGSNHFPTFFAKALRHAYF
jgi:hypothetical protein